jgi:hypothetical protein
LRVIFRKTEGPKCEICISGPQVDFKETQGLLCKMAGNFGWGFIFQRIKPWTGSKHPCTGRARSVHRGPTAVRTEGGPGRGGALTGAQPPAAPVHQSSPAGAQQREERMGSSARASPSRRPGEGGAKLVVAALGERKARARREAKRGWERCGELRGWCSPFIGVRGVPGRGGRGVALMPLKTGEGLRGELREGK